MSDPTVIKEKLYQIMQDLDPNVHGVAVAHVQDAIAAIEAVTVGETTKYALNERLEFGETVVTPQRRTFR